MRKAAVLCRVGHVQHNDCVYVGLASGSAFWIIEQVHATRVWDRCPCFDALLFAQLREKMWTVTMQRKYTDTVMVFGYSIMVISLSTYVMAACIFNLQGTLFQGRPWPF